MAIVNVDILDILKAAMAVDTFMRQRKEQQWGPTSELVKQQGFEAGEQQLGTKQMMDFYKYLFKQEPGQKTTTQLGGQLGGGYETPEAQGIPQPQFQAQTQTKRVWPALTTGQRLEQAGQQYLEAPGKAEEVVKGRMGEGTTWERSQAEAAKRQHIGTLAQSSLVHGLNVMTPQGIRPITGPESADYWTKILNGETPDIQLAPPTKPLDKTALDMQIGQLIGPLYGQDYATLHPTVKPIVDTAFALGLAQIHEGKVQPIHFKAEEVGPPSRLEFPIKGKPEEQQVRLYDKKGKLIETGVQPRWKPETAAEKGALSQQQWINNVDSAVIDSFLHTAKEDYTNQLRAMGKTPDEIKAFTHLQVMMEAISTKDPTGAVTYNVPGFTRYLSPEHKAQFDKVRIQAHGKYKGGVVQSPLAIVHETLRSEPAAETPQASAEEFMKFLMQKEKGTEQFNPQVNPQYRGKEVVNLEGSVSSERTITVEIGGKYYNIPSLVNGKQLSKDEAVNLFKLGKIQAVDIADTLPEALKKAKERSNMLGQQVPAQAKERTIRFQVGNRFFNIPQNKVLQFRKDNPNAVEVK